MEDDIDKRIAARIDAIFGKPKPATKARAPLAPKALPIASVEKSPDPNAEISDERLRALLSVPPPPFRPRRPRDPNQLAHQVVAEAVGDRVPDQPPPFPDDPIRSAAVTLGRLGGAKGGAARARNLTPTRRREIAVSANKARWKDHVKRSP